MCLQLDHSTQPHSAMAIHGQFLQIILQVNAGLQISMPHWPGIMHLELAS